MNRDWAVCKGDLAGYCETHSSTCTPQNTWTSLWFCPFLPLLPQYNPLLQRWNWLSSGGFGAQFTTKHELMTPASAAAQWDRRAEWDSWCWVPIAHCPHLGEVISASGWVLWTQVSGLLPWQLCGGNQSIVSWANQMCYENAPLS